MLGAAGDASEEGKQSSSARAELDSAAESLAGLRAPVFVQD